MTTTGYKTELKANRVAHAISRKNRDTNINVIYDSFDDRHYVTTDSARPGEHLCGVYLNGKKIYDN